MVHNNNWRNKIKRFKLVFLSLLIWAVALIPTEAQSVVMQGEFGAGVYKNLQVDTSGIMVMPTVNTLATPIAYNYTHISTAATTTVKSGTGTLSRIVVNTIGGTSTLVIYDSVTGSGTVIGAFTTLVQGSFNMNIAFTNGLTIVTAGVTQADVTIIWK